MKDSRKRLLRLLAKREYCYANDKKIATQAGLGVTYLRVVLEELAQGKYLVKIKDGRKIKYCLVAKYC